MSFKIHEKIDNDLERAREFAKEVKGVILQVVLIVIGMIFSIYLLHDVYGMSYDNLFLIFGVQCILVIVVGSLLMIRDSKEEPI